MVGQPITQCPLRLGFDLGAPRALRPIQQDEPSEPREPVVGEALAEQGEAVGAVGLEHHRQQTRRLTRYWEIARRAIIPVLPEPATRAR